MDGGAHNDGYAARIAAALKQLEDSGSLSRGRAAEMADEVLARLSAENHEEDLSQVDDRIDFDDSEEFENDAPLVLEDEVIDPEPAPYRPPRGRLRTLPQFSSGLGKSVAPETDHNFQNSDDVDDDGESFDAEPDYADQDRYASADAVYDFEETDEDVFASDDGANNLVFDGSASQLISLVLKNTVLTILTVGLYRFWAQRDMRQFLWQSVRFQEEYPEYQGRAIDSVYMFLGLTMFGVLSAGLLIVLPQLFIPFRPVTAALELFFVVGLFLAYQYWCQWRRRYNLDHTALHGIRFERSPQSLQRVVPFLGIWSLVILTAGLAYPLARVISARDLFRDVRFGPASVTIEANAQPLLVPWAIVYGTLALTFLLVGTDWLFDYQTASGGSILIYWLLSMAMIIASFGALVWYKCGEFDYFVSSLSIGQSRVYTDLPPWRLLMKASMPVFGFLIYSLSLFLLAYFSFDAFLQLTAEEVPTDIQVNGTFIALGFAATLIGGFIYQVLLNVFRLDVIKAVAEKGMIE